MQLYKSDSSIESSFFSSKPKRKTNKKETGQKKSTNGASAAS
jgi:hypothetical protein